MPRRVWLSLGMLATGVALMVVAQLAGAAPERRGGIFKVGTTGASVQIDPQLSYVTTGWWLEYATAAKLYNYRPGGKLVPEVASRLHGLERRQAVHVLHPQGLPVQRRHAGDRAQLRVRDRPRANHDLASPGAQFITDRSGVDIVGALTSTTAARRTSAASGRGQQARSSTCTRPTASLLSVLAMPFFQATSTKLPLDREVVERDEHERPSVRRAVRVHAQRREQADVAASQPVLEARPGPHGPAKPRRASTSSWNLNEQTAFEMVKANQLDEGPLPAAEVQSVANQYGVNRSRFWVKPTNACIGLDRVQQPVGASSRTTLRCARP